MAIVIIQDKPTFEDLKKAREEYKSYIKITIDVAKEIVAIGGEYHADAEKLLFAKGSKQENIWGGGVNLETGLFETNAIINLRAKTNPSADILDPTIREKFLTIAKEALGRYVKPR